MMSENMQSVIDKFKQFLPEIDFSVQGTPEERIAEQKRVYEMFRPSRDRALRKILDEKPGSTRMMEVRVDG